MSATARAHPEPDYRKPCTLCHTPRDVLVRCQIDESGNWHFLCPGSCWKKVSGGVIDGDNSDEHKFYRYGGMWKNKHEAVSAKKPKAKSSKVKPESSGDKSVTGADSTASAEVDSADGNTSNDDQDDVASSEKEAVAQQPPASSTATGQPWQSNGKAYTRNDRVVWEGQTWMCRKSHTSDEHWTPARAYSLWKTAS